MASRKDCVSTHLIFYGIARACGQIEIGLVAIRSAVSRLGVADVRAFGLTWEDCEEMLGQLGYCARVVIATA